MIVKILSVLHRFYELFLLILIPDINLLLNVFQNNLKLKLTNNSSDRINFHDIDINIFNRKSANIRCNRGIFNNRFIENVN